MIRMLLLTASMALVCIGMATIYAIGHPSEADASSFGATSDNTSESNSNSHLDTGNPQRDAPKLEASPTLAPNPRAGVWKKQLAFTGAGLVCLVFVNLFNYQRLGPISFLLYGIVLASLAILLIDKYGIMTLPFVHDRLGMHRWIKIGFGFQVQPSEFCKIAFILALAWYLRFRSNYRKFLGLIGPFALTLLAMGLILLEPDLGTTLLLMPILFSMLFVAGAKVRHLIIILCLGIAFSPVFWMNMKGYQRMRISSVLLQNDKIMAMAKNNDQLARILVGDPDNLRTWEREDGYQLLQAKRAIASGGLLGYGFGKGPYLQTSYAKLPEPHNDMIFAMIAHQFGIVGCVVMFGLYVVLIACTIELAWLNTDPFGRLAAVGFAAMFAVQVLVNVCMTLGLMPITGLTLPLVSYGGSSMVVNLIAVGLINNIGKHRPFTVAKRPFEFAG